MAAAAVDWKMRCDPKTYHGSLSQECLKDIEALDDNDCGFCRDVSTDVKGCRGDLKKFTHHVVVVTDQPATEWAPKLEGGSDAELAVKNITDALGKGAPVKVSLATFPGSNVVAPGDVLVFADAAAPRVFRNVRPSALPSAEALLCEGEPLPRESQFVMACAHLKRDARCGYCGPVLHDIVRGMNLPHTTVGKISHIGGHMYAGNLLVYDKVGCDWFGYVSPNNVRGIVRREWTPDVTQRWRGRIGVAKDEHAKLVEEVVARGGGAGELMSRVCRMGVLAAIATGLYAAHVQKGWKNPLQ